MTFNGPKGTAYVYKGSGHDWTVDYWSTWTRKHGSRHVVITYTNSNKQGAIVRAKQLTGLFDKPKGK